MAHVYCIIVNNDVCAERFPLPLPDNFFSLWTPISARPYIKDNVVSTSPVYMQNNFSQGGVCSIGNTISNVKNKSEIW